MSYNIVHIYNVKELVQTTIGSKQCFFLSRARTRCWPFIVPPPSDPAWRRMWRPGCGRGSGSSTTGAATEPPGGIYSGQAHHCILLDVPPLVSSFFTEIQSTYTAYRYGNESLTVYIYMFIGNHVIWAFQTGLFLFECLHSACPPVSAINNVIWIGVSAYPSLGHDCSHYLFPMRYC